MHIDYATFCELKENKHCSACIGENKKSFCICDSINFSIIELNRTLEKKKHLHFGCGQVCCQYIDTVEDLDKAIDYLARKKCIGHSNDDMNNLEERFSKLAM